MLMFIYKEIKTKIYKSEKYSMQKQSLKGTVTVNGKHFGIVTLPIDGDEIGAVVQLGKVAGKGAKIVGFFTELHPFDTDRFSVWVNKAGRIIVSSESVVRVRVGDVQETGFKGFVKSLFTREAHQTRVVTSPQTVMKAYQSWTASPTAV